MSKAFEEARVSIDLREQAIQDIRSRLRNEQQAAKAQITNIESRLAEYEAECVTREANLLREIAALKAMPEGGSIGNS